MITRQTHIDTQVVHNESRILQLFSEIASKITSMALVHYKGSTLTSSIYQILIDQNSKNSLSLSQNLLQNEIVSETISDLQK